MKFSSPNFDLEVPFFCTFIYQPNYSPIPYLLPKNDECSNPELKLIKNQEIIEEKMMTLTPVAKRLQLSNVSDSSCDDVFDAMDVDSE